LDFTAARAEVEAPGALVEISTTKNPAADLPVRRIGRNSKEAL